jgi:hypothetical protein
LGRCYCFQINKARNSAIEQDDPRQTRRHRQTSNMMSTGPRGTFVISWAQTEADGLRAPGIGLVCVGAAWRWTGEAVRVDRPGGPLLLEGPEGSAERRRRAARMVRRLVGAATARDGQDGEPDGDDVAEQGFTLTDGRQVWDGLLIPVPESRARLVMFEGALPPVDTDLWVVRTTIDPRLMRPDAVAQGGVICFASGTMITTPQGLRTIESLRPGDRVDTVDSGPQPVVWAGHRRMTGARLHVMPHLRPVRIRPGALGGGRPDVDLLVSPRHRVLLRGRAADALFGTPEVLVRACDLIDDRQIHIDTAVREVTYVHVMLEAHHVVLANGLETESFHPLSAALDTLDPGQRSDLMQVLPDPGRYGGFARRCLSAPETAILRFDAA